MTIGPIFPPGTYNLSDELLGRNLEKHPHKVAFIDDAGSYTYSEVASRADRTATVLLSRGLEPGAKLVLCVLDGIDFVTTFLGAVKAGIVPIPLNTLFQPSDYGHILVDSGARAAAVSGSLIEVFLEAVRLSGWDGELIVSGTAVRDEQLSLSSLIASASPLPQAHATAAKDIAFWLYSSGSTGQPKGAPHRHGSPAIAAKCYASETFGLLEQDVVFSVAKLFFAYGLGNALFFPMMMGATAVLYPGRVTPDVVGKVLRDYGTTVFCGVPTLYASLLATDNIPSKEQLSLRRCMSAGEALPAEIGEAWERRTGTEIIDGIGSTEMLHIFISNRPGAVRYGTTGTPVPGYEVKLVDEAGEEVGPGGIGELYVRGPTMTPLYWNNPTKTADTFIGGWMKTGDKFVMHEDGRLSHCGRADDMLKVSGIWVSPTEIEGVLTAHEAVKEAAVIGIVDRDGLTKTKAFIVLKPGYAAGDELALTLKLFTKSRLAAYKYPRAFAFVDELPRTSTGKVRRHVLREQEAQAAASNDDALAS